MSLGTFRTHARSALMAGSVAILIAACGSSGATTAPTTAPTAAAAATLAKASTSKGDALVGSNGHTLYTFDKDTTPGASACSGGCASTWPALTVTGTPTAGSGVSGTLATFARTDSGTQVTYNGKPLYYYAPDTKAGDVSGDGIGGIWHIATP
jgi:predicted lipoprotein with Yx(FWY)xxD motif